jgi:hypothetical protein
MACGGLKPVTVIQVRHDLLLWPGFLRIRDAVVLDTFSQNLRTGLMGVNHGAVSQ